MGKMGKIALKRNELYDDKYFKHFIDSIEDCLVRNFADKCVVLCGLLILSQYCFQAKTLFYL